MHREYACRLGGTVKEENMRTVVKCLNCGIIWVRVIAVGDLEMTVNLQYNCPACGSNWCEDKEEGKK